jgi:hypothetical protein
MRLSDIVISETRWQSLEGLRRPILAEKGFSCAFRKRSGERSSRRYGETMWSRAVVRRFPSGSVTSWSLTPASCSRSRSRARLCVPCQEALRTGSGGASPRPYAGQLLADGSLDARVGNVQALSENGSSSIKAIQLQNPKTSHRCGQGTRSPVGESSQFPTRLLPAGSILEDRERQLHDEGLSGVNQHADIRLIYRRLKLLVS